jgi:hypothetical protein
VSAPVTNYMPLRAKLQAGYKTVDAQFLREKDGKTPWRP